MRLSTRRPTAVATATGLPRFARNDTGCRREWFRAHGVGCEAQPSFRPAPEPWGFHPHPNPLEGVGNRRSDSLRSLESGTDKGWVFLTRTHLICHCERRSTGSGPAGISVRLNTGGRTAVVAATGLPRYAHNDNGGTLKNWAPMRAQFIRHGERPSTSSGRAGRVNSHA